MGQFLKAPNVGEETAKRTLVSRARSVCGGIGSPDWSVPIFKSNNKGGPFPLAVRVILHAPISNGRILYAVQIGAEFGLAEHLGPATVRAAANQRTLTMLLICLSG